MSEEKIDARIRRSRQLLREALLSLIEEKGFDDITVRDLTARAAINRSTFYLHYQDKRDLLVQTLTDVFARFRQSVEVELPAASGTDRLQQMLVSLFDHLGAHADIYRMILSEKGFHRFGHRMLTEMRESYKQMLGSLELDERGWAFPMDFFINYICSAHFGLIMWWLQNDRPHSSKYMAEHLTRLTHATAREMRPN